MTYLGFLALFLGLPLAALAGFTWRAAQRRRAGFPGRQAMAALLAHVVIAVVYTTPWDNYLVATGVWWYDPRRVVGATLGWVPLEEYLFFVLQTLVAGLLLFAFRRGELGARLPFSGGKTWAPNASGLALRAGSTVTVALVWLGAVAVLAAGWQPGTYLGLTLAWALPPIGLQLAVGGDVLWRKRRSVLRTLGLLTAYLCLADALAINAGVWTIDPAQSLNVFIGGVLPVEEAIFFLLTNTLVVLGLTLTLASETRQRWEQVKALALRRPVTEGA
jgi:lycopene cyclase domain-containing protein